MRPLFQPKITSLLEVNLTWAKLHVQYFLEQLGLFFFDLIIEIWRRGMLAIPLDLVGESLVPIQFLLLIFE